MAAIILCLSWNRNSFISKYLLAENLDWRLTQYLVLLLARNRNLAALKICPEENPPQDIVYLSGDYRTRLRVSVPDVPSLYDQSTYRLSPLREVVV